MSYYPPCPEEGALPFFLETVARHLEEDPAYLDDPECPYEEDTRKVLLLLTPKTSIQERIEEVQAADPDEDRWEFLDREVQSLFKDLKEEVHHVGVRFLYFVK